MLLTRGNQHVAIELLETCSIDLLPRALIITSYGLEADLSSIRVLEQRLKALVTLHLLPNFFRHLGCIWIGHVSVKGLQSDLANGSFVLGSPVTRRRSHVVMGASALSNRTVAIGALLAYAVSHLGA